MHKIGMRLTEILVIVLIFLLLVVILIPTMPGSSREEFRRNKCTSNQRQIAMAIAMYASEHQSQFPGTISTVAKHRWALINIADAEQTSWRRPLDLPEKIFDCPAADRGKASYGCNATLPGAKVAAIVCPDSTIITADTAGHNLICSPPEISMRHSLTGKAAECGYIATFADSHDEYFYKIRPADPPAIDVTLATVLLGQDNKTNFILDGINVITVDSTGKITPDATANGKLYPNSYLTIYVTEATTRVLDVLHVRSASGHLTKVLLPADAKAKDIYVIKLPDSGLAGWKLNLKGGGPATLAPTMTP